MNSVTASGQIDTNRSANSKISTWYSFLTLEKEPDISSINIGTLEHPEFTSFSESLMNLMRSPDATLGRALAPASKKVLTSLHDVSTSVDAREINASLSSPISGKIFRAKPKHSADKS